MPILPLRLALVLLINVAGARVLADDDDQDRARQALEAGEIRPLDQVLDVARKQVSGEVVKVELEREHGGWVYEFKILDAQGKRREIEIDASSLRVLEVD